MTPPFFFALSTTIGLMPIHRMAVAVATCALLSAAAAGAERAPVDARAIGLSTTATAERNSRSLESIPDNTTVIVPPGSYRIGQTTFSGKTNIRIVGAGSASRLLVDDARYGIVIARSSGITLENLYLGGTSRVALYVYDASGIQVLKNHVTGATKAGSGPMAGIELLGVSDARIEGNDLTGNGNGTEPASYEIVAFPGALNERISIRNNTIVGTGTHYGIVLFMTRNGVVSGNRVHQGNVGNRKNSGYGVASYGVGKPNTGLTISGNVIDNTAGSGIYCANSRDVTIEGNRVSDTGQTQNDATLTVGAIALNTVDNAILYGNTIANSHATAISLSTVSSVKVERNTVSNSSTRSDLNFPAAIHLRGTASNIEIVGNTLRRSVGAGISYLIPSAPMNGIRIDNNVLDGAAIAIELGRFKDAVISNNRISNYRQAGIQVDSGTNAVVTGNTLSHGTARPLAVHADNNVVSGNVIE